MLIRAFARGRAARAHNITPNARRTEGGGRQGTERESVDRVIETPRSVSRDADRGARARVRSFDSRRVVARRRSARWRGRGRVAHDGEIGRAGRRCDNRSTAHALGFMSFFVTFRALRWSGSYRSSNSRAQRTCLCRLRTEVSHVEPERCDVTIRNGIGGTAGSACFRCETPLNGAGLFLELDATTIHPDAMIHASDRLWPIAPASKPGADTRRLLQAVVPPRAMMSCDVTRIMACFRFSVCLEPFVYT